MICMKEYGYEYDVKGNLYWVPFIIAKNIERISTEVLNSILQLTLNQYSWENTFITILNKEIDQRQKGIK